MILALCLVLYASPVWAITVVSNSYTGNATDNTDITTAGCQPVAVFVKRETAGVELYGRFDSMGANVSKMVTGTTGQATDQIKSFLANGFRLGTGSSVNGNTATHYYVAICDNGANDIATGTYAGDNNDNTNIAFASATFTPEVCWVLQSSTGINVWRGATSHSGDSASSLNTAASSAANLIQSFTAGGFQVGSGMNASGVTYYYLCLKGSASGVATGNFAGNTSDNRDISTGHTPEFAMVKGDSTTNQTAHRFGIAGDASWCDSAASAVNIIEAFEATNFQVGTSTCANENGVTMRWLSVADVAASATRRPIPPIMLGY